jgi:hypothetical protein
LPGLTEHDCSLNKSLGSKAKADFADTETLRFKFGDHCFEIRRWLSESSDGFQADQFRPESYARYVGYYDDRLSVSASKRHIALQMLLRRHFKKKRSGTGA